MIAVGLCSVCTQLLYLRTDRTVRNHNRRSAPTQPTPCPGAGVEPFEMYVLPDWRLIENLLRDFPWRSFGVDTDTASPELFGALSFRIGEALKQGT